MADKMKNTPIIVLTRAAYLSYQPPPTPYLPSFLVCLLRVCSDINIIIAYTKEIRRVEENRVSSTQWTITAIYQNPLVTDLISAPL